MCRGLNNSCSVLACDTIALYRFINEALLFRALFSFLGHVKTLVCLPSMGLTCIHLFALALIYVVFLVFGAVGHMGNFSLLIVS